MGAGFQLRSRFPGFRFNKQSRGFLVENLCYRVETQLIEVPIEPNTVRWPGIPRSAAASGKSRIQEPSIKERIRFLADACPTLGKGSGLLFGEI